MFEPTGLFRHEGRDSNDMLARALIQLDKNTLLHSWRTRELALILGESLGLSSRELAVLGLGALLHDIGKGFISLLVLEKQTPLTHEEWELIQTHPLQGYHYLRPVDVDDTIKAIVLGHHRWLNGRGGYPKLPGSPPPDLLTQIVTVADVVDAMTSPRPYRPALSLEICLSHLEAHSTMRYNGEIVGVFKRIVMKHPSYQ